MPLAPHARSRAAAAVALGVVAAGLAAAPASAADRTTIVSRGDTTLAGRAPFGNADSTYPAMSSDGGRVAFLSRATNLAAGTANGTANLVYVRDVETGTVRRASTRCPATGACVPSTTNASAVRISADGRYVAFRTADALLPEDTNGANDLYRYDVETGRNALITDGSRPELAGAPSNLALSGDGRRVVYARGPVGDETAAHLVVRDLDAPGAAPRVLDVTPDGTPSATAANGNAVALGSTGRWAVFASGATDLDPVASPPAVAVYRVDLSAERLRPQRVSVLPDGTPFEAQLAGTQPGQAVSADGSRVLVASQSEAPAPAGTPASSLTDWAQYVLDVPSGRVLPVGVAEDGTMLPSSFYGALSADGRRVAFAAPGRIRPLEADGGSSRQEVFVRDLASTTTVRASLGADDAVSDADAEQPQISADGHYVSFQSRATTLTPSGSWGVQAFRRDVREPAPAEPAPGTPAAPVDPVGPLVTRTSVVAPLPAIAPREATLTAGRLDLRRVASAPVARALRAAGVRVSATRPATTTGGRARLPVRSGTIAAAADVRTGGVVRLRRTAGGRARTVALTDVRLELGARSRVTARIGGRRTIVFTVAAPQGRVVNPWTAAARLRTGRLALTAVAAREIAARLRTGRLASGRYGTIALTAAGTPGAPGRAAVPGWVSSVTAPAPAAPAPATPTPDDARPVVAIGSATWGFQAFFRSYVRGGDGRPPLEAGDGATYSGAEDTFRFAATESTYDPATRRGTIALRGWIRFNYPGHLFFITIRDPRLTVDGDAGTLEGTVRSDLYGQQGEAKQVRIATLDLSGATRTAGADGSVLLSGIGATLDAEAVPQFGGFWEAGQTLDPIAVALDGR